MNLVTDPFIPVIIDKKEVRMSLKEIFTRTKDIKDLTGNPIEKLSILRLLICIVQRALNGPEDDKDWKTCKKNICKASLEYLEKKKSCFDLYGKKPFLQVKYLDQSEKSHKNSYLSVFFAPGNLSHCLFDNEARHGIERELTDPAEITRMLLIVQIFGSCGLKWRHCGETKWGDKKLTSHQGKASVASNNLLSYFKGSCLLDTIHYNLIQKKWLDEAKMKFGKPVWEYDIKTQDKNCVDYNSYLYNLVPLCKGILLDKKSAEISLSDGICPQEDYRLYRDPMGSLKKKKGKITGYLKVDPNKALWRNLVSILQAHTDEGAWPLRYLKEPVIKNASLVAGGILYNKSKPLMACEWEIELPPDGVCIGDAEISLYTECIKTADLGAWVLETSILNYLKKEKKDKKSNAIYLSLKNNAQNQYWYNLEKHAKALLNLILDHELEKEKEIRQNWIKTIRNESIKAFENVSKKLRKKDFESYVKSLNFIKRYPLDKLKERSNDNE